MRKIVVICVYFVIGISCFALGHQKEEKQIVTHILNNTNVASVHLKRNTHNWVAVINLKNGGLIKIKKCDMEGMLDGRMMFEQFGDYQIWACCRIKGRENQQFSWLAAAVSFSEILQTHFNCIDDFINNYDIIIELLQKLENESEKERFERMHMVYTDSDFLNYYGNYENVNFFGCVFARKYQVDFSDEDWCPGVE